MTKLKLLSAGVILTAMAVAPGLAEARSHHRYHHHPHVHLYSLPYEISYKHNYGPGSLHCAQSAAAYVGQDRRRYACN
jgi:hypothetical protein